MIRAKIATQPQQPKLEGIKHATAILGVAGVRGLNLSNPAAAGKERNMARDFAQVARALHQTDLERNAVIVPILACLMANWA